MPWPEKKNIGRLFLQLSGSSAAIAWYHSPIASLQLSNVGTGDALAPFSSNRVSLAVGLNSSHTLASGASSYWYLSRSHWKSRNAVSAETSSCPSPYVLAAGSGPSCRCLYALTPMTTAKVPAVPSQSGLLQRPGAAPGSSAISRLRRWGVGRQDRST